MRKVWITMRKGIPGKYVEWYDDTGHRKSKYFGPEYTRYANQYRARKFAELNSDIRPIGSTINIPWSSAREDYLKRKRLEGLAEKSIWEIKNTFTEFENSISTSISGTSCIKQSTIDDFVSYLQSRNSTHIDRLKSTKEKIVKLQVSPNTINKYLRNLRAILGWMEQKKYIRPGIEIKKVKADDKVIRILSNSEIKSLVTACGDNKQWRMRILLAASTGLRRGDIDNLTIKSIDVEKKTISITNQKTGKVTSYQPLPDKLMPEIEKFILEEVSDGQVMLFKTKFSKQWDEIRRKAGLSDIDFHDLRRTFVSLQADAGVPIKALQEMLNHSNIETTMKHYIKTGNSEKRDGVNKLNVAEWI